MAKKTENEVKETKKEAAVMDEAAKEKFQQKLKDLLALAKKKKNMLEYQEISDFFADMQLMKTRSKWKKSTFPCRMACPLKIRSVCI